ncbi:EamA family transporter [Microvirga sp. ACRRW]|uniref:DMT family transporter n=1 Tax=Microvirga sp. ACRRW TaxID=2918205 RepID=UPI001EF62465|nr:EamA family transporter [Microvirga sp. ACRRW]MCG7394495.1 EamA family transporter [Microvirga sp. ACRRW]
MSHQKTNYALELSLLAALATLWAAAYTFIKVGVETIPPITLIATRTLIAGSLLVLIMRLRGVSLPRDRMSWRNFMIQACLNSAVPFTLIAWAETSIDAGLAVILNSMTPVFTFLITLVWSRHETTGLRKFAGVVIGLTGTCVIVGNQALTHVGQELYAQLAVVLAAMCYAGAAIFGRNFKNLDPMAPAAGSLLSGAMILIPISLIVDKPWTLAPSGASVMALVALAVFSTSMAFVIYFRLLHTLGSVGTTAQAYLRVPLGVAIGIYFLGETPDATALVGLVCILIGVAFMTLPERKRVAIAAA